MFKVFFKIRRRCQFHENVTDVFSMRWYRYTTYDTDVIFTYKNANIFYEKCMSCKRPVQNNITKVFKVKDLEYKGKKKLR